MSSIRKLKSVIILILIPLLLVLIWFRSSLIRGGGEEGLMFYNPTKTLQLSNLMWWDYDGGFPTLAWLSKITSLFPVAFLFEKLSFPNYILQAGTFFILLSIGGISVYFLTLNLLDKFHLRKIVAFVAAIFYLFNPYSFSQIWGRGLYSQFFSFALLPLATLLFLSGLKGKFINVFYLTFASLLFSSAFGISTFVMTYWLVLTICLIYWILVNRQKPKNILYSIFFYISALILWSIVNSFWLLPSIISGNKIYLNYLENFQENLGTLLGVSRNFQPLVIIRLLQRTYFFDSSAFSPIYSSFIFQLISWLSPIFLIIGLVTTIRKGLQQFRFFILLFAIGLLVSLGANPPIGWLFVWIFKHAPFLQSFRNPYEKFGLVYALSYSPLFALGLTYFFEQKFQHKKFKILGLVAVLILVCGVYAWPMWTGRVVALPDSPLGIDVPQHYQDLNTWLNNRKGGYRMFMTPIWVGDGAFYDWNSTRYRGIDPMIYILDTPPISSSPKFPYFYDFMQNIRKYMERVNVAPSLSLLRTRYLINRQDAIMITEAERNHYQYLSSEIYPPSDTISNLTAICTDKKADSKANGLTWIVCEIPAKDRDWSSIRYLHLDVKTDTDAILEIAIRDQKETRIRWDGRMDHQYSIKSAPDGTKLIIPLSNPTEYNSDIDFSKIYLLEVLAHPKQSPQTSVKELSLKEIRLDTGNKKQINTFHHINSFGKLKVYEPIQFTSPPEFGALFSLETVGNFEELFEKIPQQYQTLQRHGFILYSQNQGKNLDVLQDDLNVKVLQSDRISDTRYFIKVEENKPAYLILSQNYHPQWRVLLGVEKNQLGGGFFEDLQLLKKASVSEQNHFVVNGYANLWQVDGQNRQYAIVFMPQVMADIGLKISAISVILLAVLTAIWWFKRGYTR